MCVCVVERFSILESMRSRETSVHLTTQSDMMPFSAPITLSHEEGLVLLISSDQDGGKKETGDRVTVALW